MNLWHESGVDCPVQQFNSQMQFCSYPLVDHQTFSDLGAATQRTNKEFVWKSVDTLVSLVHIEMKTHPAAWQKSHVVQMPLRLRGEQNKALPCLTMASIPTAEANGRQKVDDQHHIVGALLTLVTMIPSHSSLCMRLQS